MAFDIYTFKEEERRSYTLTLWTCRGEIITPKGGIVECENDIRLFYYGNGPYRDASNEFQFVFDYKGIVFNVNIAEKIEDNDVYYSLIEIDEKKELFTNEIKRK